MRAITLAFVLLVGCGGEQRRTYDYRPQTLGPRVAQARRPSIGGFFLEAPFMREASRCGSRGVFSSDPGQLTGSCTNTIEPIGYPVQSVFLRRCGRSELCEISVNVRLDGETQLQHALSDVLRTWTQRYGREPDDVLHETDPRCDAELRETRFGCLLGGEALYLVRWRFTDAQLREPAVAQLSALGTAGTQLATMSLTLATESAVRAGAQRDL